MRRALSIRDRGGHAAARPLAERLLEALGADPSLTDSILGDLAEERAERAARDGARRAAAWYLWETLRSVPWLAASAVRRPGWRGRTQVAAAGAMMALLATAVVMLVLSIAGDPARLVANGDVGDGVVVNNTSAVRLGMRVLDARGHVLPDSGVRYRWTGGAPIAVSATGITKCMHAGDANVRATLGDVATDLVLRCRPVRMLTGKHNVGLVVGGPPAPIPFVALDSALRPVTMLRGELSLSDPAIATLERGPDGQRFVRARAPGVATVDVAVGDRTASVLVETYLRASTLERMKPGQRLAVPVGLHTGEVRQWKLPASRELYFIKMLADGSDEDRPLIAISGANCVYEGLHSFFCAAPRGATLFAYYPVWGDQSRELRGDVAVERREFP